MTNQHPITPPPELVQQWVDMPLPTKKILVIASQWGADQELEACCKLLDEEPHDGPMLHAVRRPKPPSLKEQALEALQFVDEKLDLPLHNHCNAVHTIRRALEALPE